MNNFLDNVLLVEIIINQPCVLEDDIRIKKYIFDTRGFIYDLVKWNKQALLNATKEDLIYIVDELFKYYKKRDIRVSHEIYDLRTSEFCDKCKYNGIFSDFTYCKNSKRCKRMFKDLYEP